VQSRSQSAQASRSVGSHQERLWGTGIFTAGILQLTALSFVTVNSQPKNNIFPLPKRLRPWLSTDQEAWRLWEWDWCLARNRVQKNTGCWIHHTTHNFWLPVELCWMMLNDVEKCWIVLKVFSKVWLPPYIHTIIFNSIMSDQAQIFLWFCKPSS